jgi:hypothetical protein
MATAAEKKRILPMGDYDPCTIKHKHHHSSDDGDPHRRRLKRHNREPEHRHHRRHPSGCDCGCGG